MLKFLILLLAAGTFCLAADNSAIAARLAKKAEQVRNSGQLVRAYLLLSEAAVRDPQHVSYAVNRDAIAPLAHLLSTSQVGDVNIADDVKEATKEAEEPLLNPLSEVMSQPGEEPLQGPPHLQIPPGLHSFDLRLDSKNAILQVARTFGIDVVFDPEFTPDTIGRFQMTETDFRTAMEAITSVSHTFLFPLNSHTIFVARDTEQKRSEYEPTILVSVPLPDTVDRKDVLEAANAVRGALGLKAVAWDETAQTVVIRDHVSAAHAAAALLQSVILPRAQVSLQVQIVAVDSSKGYHYGVALPTSFGVYSFAQLGNLQMTAPDLTSAASSIFAFGAAHAFFGVALGNATLFASYTSSISKVLYEATVVVADGQSATLHVGDKYPIPTALNTGSQNAAASAYNPIGEVTQEDLGIRLKVSPHINGSEIVGLDIEAEYESLSGASLDGVPAVTERTFKGAVRLGQDEYAIIAGLADDEHSVSKSGLPGIAQIPGVDQVLAENTRTQLSSNTLLTIKPTITRLPMDATVSPQFLLGGRRGERVLL